MSRSKAMAPHFPPAMLFAYGALIVASLILVAWSRLTAGTAVPDLLPAVVEARTVAFRDLPDGSIRVQTLDGEHQLGVVAAGEDGFVRSTLRGLYRERRRFGADPGGALQLIRRVDGSLTLNDPSTQITLDLGAFGPSNVASFAAFMMPLGQGQNQVKGMAPGELAVAAKSGSSSQ